MTTIRRSMSVLVLALACGAALTACVVVPAEPYRGGVVSVAPPPPQAEVVGVAPVPGYVWIGGYWNWVGSRHVWIGGRWEAPRHGHYWVPHAWHREGPGWRHHHGYWARR